jgi:hypothetical protein
VSCRQDKDRENIRDFSDGFRLFGESTLSDLHQGGDAKADSITGLRVLAGLEDVQ